MNLDLSGKRAMICGSTQGIGKASALALASLGAEVVLVARNEDKLRVVRDQLAAPKGQKHTYLVADFERPDELRSTVDSFTQSAPVHILINNTGGPAAGPAFDAKIEDFQKAFSAHLICNHILVQAVVPGMKKEKYGRIVNIISTSVKIPIVGLGVSNTVRAAVANWSKTLSIELAAFGITVNNVLPGATMTGRLEAIIKNKSEKTGKTLDEVKHEMIAEIPARRIAEPEEVAAAVAFLATPAAGYINGVNIPVDGGRTGSL